MKPYKRFHFDPTTPGLKIDAERQREVQKNGVKASARGSKRRAAEKLIEERTKQIEQNYISRGDN